VGSVRGRNRLLALQGLDGFRDGREQMISADHLQNPAAFQVVVQQP